MPNLNSVIIMGNLTRDPEIRYIASGTAVADLGMAINEKKKQGEEWVDDTTFVDVTLWGRTAEVASEYLKKGSPCLIQGRLKYETWEKDGQKRSKLKVVGDKLQLLGSKDSNGAPSRSRDTEYSRAGASAPAKMPPDDDIPF